jgi:anti-anti-sigma factor
MTADGYEPGETTAYPLHGEYDLENASELSVTLRRISDESCDDVVLDCEDLRFWDSSAVTVLVDTQQRLRARGRKLLLTNLTDGPRRVLEVLGIAESFGVDGQSGG